MYSLIYSPFPTKKKAENVVKVLVKEKLIACGNIFKVNSIFRWKKSINKSGEYVAIMKTKTKLVKKVENKIKKLHPYECPCIINFKFSGNKEYLKWLRESTQ